MEGPLERLFFAWVAAYNDARPARQGGGETWEARAVATIRTTSLA